jgi:pimeloyl-ACP methyl ester carboxylesterase
MVGHDIGLMIAYAYAQAYRDEVSHLIVIDPALPGTAVFDRLRSDPRVWHFAFHGARDVAEMLVAGRERQYVQAFFDARVFDPSAISETGLNLYTPPTCGLEHAQEHGCGASVVREGGFEPSPTHAHRA